MRSLRRPAIAVSLVSIFLWSTAAVRTRSCWRVATAQLGQPGRDERPGPPDPCELALTPRGRGQRAAPPLRVGGIGRRRARRLQRRRPGRSRDRRAVRGPRRHRRRRHRAGLLRVGELDSRPTAINCSTSARSGSRSAPTITSGGRWPRATSTATSKSDLAIGVPEYESTGSGNNGLVLVIEGAATGLDTSSVRSIGTLAGARGRAGATLAWGDFNGDEIGDLAIGVPNSAVRGEGFACSQFALDVTNAGEVQVFYGSGNGLERLRREAAGPGQVRSRQHRRGRRRQHRGRRPFRVVADGAARQRRRRSGHRRAVRGPRPGRQDRRRRRPRHSRAVWRVCTPATPSCSRRTRQVSAAAPSRATSSAASSDRATSTAGLPIWSSRCPSRTSPNNTEADAGAVHVFPDINDIADAANGLFISQTDLTGATAEAGDRFGWAVAAGDFNGDGYDELAIGSPGENVGDTDRCRPGGGDQRIDHGPARQHGAHPHAGHGGHARRRRTRRSVRLCALVVELRRQHARGISRSARRSRT